MRLSLCVCVTQRTWCMVPYSITNMMQDFIEIVKLVHIEVVRFYVVKTGFFPSIKPKAQIER